MEHSFLYTIFIRKEITKLIWCLMTTLYDQRYVRIIEQLIKLRESAGISRTDVAAALNTKENLVAAVEEFKRRLDVIELHDWLDVLQFNRRRFLGDVGWLEQENSANIPALPLPNNAHSLNYLGAEVGTVIRMAWRGEPKEVSIEKLKVEDYLYIEKEITKLFQALNNDARRKNRDAICEALKIAIYTAKGVNPSDLYHHVVYRIYLREYVRTQADRSWVRAGGEALELFLADHYNSVLASEGIHIRWLCNDELKESALREMGIHDEVGGSKLDLALYGRYQGRDYIFGGIHVKASLAERVSDDVPCSEAMMRKGHTSILLTLDAKSFPPPQGDLVNRGELGSPNAPSDKRAYIESHGAFSACVCYNTRSLPSNPQTQSGKRIYVSTFEHDDDPLPNIIRSAWHQFRQSRNFVNERAIA